MKGGEELNVVLYGHRNDFEHCVSCMDALPELQYRQIRYTHADDYDVFVRTLPQSDFDLVIILADGADGMEGVIAAKKLCPDTSVVWFSDDKGFLSASYRLDCIYFAQKPLTADILGTAMESYRKAVAG